MVLSPRERRCSSKPQLCFVILRQHSEHGRASSAKTRSRQAFPLLAFRKNLRRNSDAYMEGHQSLIALLQQAPQHRDTLLKDVASQVAIRRRLPVNSKRHWNFSGEELLKTSFSDIGNIPPEPMSKAARRRLAMRTFVVSYGPMEG